MIESEEIKLVQMQEDQFADLDRKLQQVEQLRRDNKQRVSEIKTIFQFSICFHVASHSYFSCFFCFIIDCYRSI